MPNPQHVFQLGWPVSTHCLVVSHTIAVLAAGLNLDILFRTGSHPVQAYINATSSVAPASITFFEATTTSADGTALDEIDINRVDPLTSGVLAFHTPTVSATGLELGSQAIPAGLDKKGTVAGTVQTTVPFILAAGTDYLLRLNNATVSNAEVISRILYSETPR